MFKKLLEFNKIMVVFERIFLLHSCVYRHESYRQAMWDCRKQFAKLGFLEKVLIHLYLYLHLCIRVFVFVFFTGNNLQSWVRGEYSNDFLEKVLIHSPGKLLAHKMCFELPNGDDEQNADNLLLSSPEMILRKLANSCKWTAC